MEKNKTGKYFKYAIGEIILVVIGILIALQINNWNELRKGRIEETKILKGLLEDFKETQHNLEYALETYPKALHRLESQVNFIGYDKEFCTQGMKDTLGSVGLLKTKIVQGSLNGLLSSNNFQLISNDSLKNLLTAYPSSVNLFKERELDTWNIIKDEHRPIVARYISLTDKLISQTEKFPNLEQRAIKSDYEGLLKDRDFQNILVDEMWHIRQTTSSAKELLIKTKDIVKQINEKLKTKEL